jgi:OFA family oxalate/formate antiporter-like MFS transporter
MEGKNRWLIAIMGTLLMVVLGSVYAWSFFQKPIIAQYGWSNSGVAWVFSMSIVFLGLSAAWGGINLPKYGPRKLAMLGSILWGAGWLIGSLALSISSLPLLIIGVGVIGGCGLGLGYVTPVVTSGKWFPDKFGFVTGMVVMGFGFGALIMSKIFAPIIMNITDSNLVTTFLYIGIIFLVLGFPAATFIRPPAAGYVPEGYTPPVKTAAQTAATADITVKQSVTSGKFIMMWLIFFINITAGIMLIGFQSPMMQDITGKNDPTLDALALASIGATLIAITSIFNGVGRFFWGGLSDKIGRVQAFRLIIGINLLVFILLMFVGNPWIFGALFCIVLLNYGGGFGTMPSFVGTIFGTKLQPAVYGIILTAWSTAGIVGPQIAAIMKDKFPETASTYSFIAAAGLLVIGLVIAFMLNNKSLAETLKK